MPRDSEEELLADPFHLGPVAGAPQSTPAAEASEEKPAPDTIPAPAPEPSTDTYAPSPRRVAQE